MIRKGMNRCMLKTSLSNEVQSTADPGGDVPRGELFRAGAAGGPARAARVRAGGSAGLWPREQEYRHYWTTNKVYEFPVKLERAGRD